MKNFRYLAIMLLSILTIVSCQDNSAEEINDFNYITIDAFEKGLVVNEGTTLDTEFKVYTSKKMGADTTINLDVTTSMSSDTYSVPVSVVIPKGSNEVTIPLSLIDDASGLNRMGETMTIAINGPEDYFTGNSKVDVSISVLCPSDLAGSWTYSDGNGKTVAITQSSAGNYSVQGDNAFGSNYYYDISDACGNITITGGRLEDFGIPVSGSGTVSADKQTITLTYTVDGYFADRTMTLVKN